ncbi:MAG: zinc-binding dehydrogenase [Trueperaceae bacterium]|nr:zinc-binding dehydrogenase [Trueperaceae bacterium]
MRAVQITEFGGPEVLEVAQLPDPEAGEGQLLVDVTTAGVNYADTHQVEDSYLSSTELPLIPGSEVVGTTADGRRVAAFCGTGGYAEKVAVPETAVFDLPAEVDDTAGVAMLVQGLTAFHLLTTCTGVGAGDTVAIHAAAGGVGSLLVQLAKRAGAKRIVGTASTEEKRALAEELGCDATVDSRAQDMKAALEDACDGKPDVVIDMVGGDTTDQSLAALAPLGRYAFYGMASREAPSPIRLEGLMQRSKTVSGFWLMDCFRRPQQMISEPLEELYTLVATGGLQVEGGSRYPLSEVRQCHEDLRGRRTTGKVTLDCTA